MTQKFPHTLTYAAVRIVPTYRPNKTTQPPIGQSKGSAGGALFVAGSTYARSARMPISIPFATRTGTKTTRTLHSRKNIGIVNTRIVRDQRMASLGTIFEGPAGFMRTREYCTATDAKETVLCANWTSKVGLSPELDHQTPLSTIRLYLSGLVVLISPGASQPMSVYTVEMPDTLQINAPRISAQHHNQSSKTEEI